MATGGRRRAVAKLVDQSLRDYDLDLGDLAGHFHLRLEGFAALGTVAVQVRFRGRVFGLRAFLQALVGVNQYRAHRTTNQQASKAYQVSKRHGFLRGVLNSSLPTFARECKGIGMRTFGGTIITFLLEPLVTQAAADVLTYQLGSLRR